METNSPTKTQQDQQADDPAIIQISNQPQPQLPQLDLLDSSPQQHQSLQIQSSQKIQDEQFQLAFFQRTDPTIQKILFISTFTAVYEVVTSPVDGQPLQQKSLDIEGSLFLLQTTQPPYYKLLLLNRVSRDDLWDWVTDQTEFAEKDNYLAYTSQGIDGLPIRRILYFSIAEEKTEFLKKVKQCIAHKQQQPAYSSEKQIIKETLMKLVQDDQFLDYFISQLKKREKSTTTTN